MGPSASRPCILSMPVRAKRCENSEEYEVNVEDTVGGGIKLGLV